jgi:hypothetical protein
MSKNKLNGYSKTFLLFSFLLFQNCASILLQHWANDRYEIHLDKPTVLKSVLESSNGWIQLNFSDLDSQVEYERCIGNNLLLILCPKEEVFEHTLQNIIEYHESQGNIGIWSLDERYLLLSSYIKSQIYLTNFTYSSQPVMAEISSDGKEILLTYPLRFGSGKICYHEKIDYNEGRFLYIEDCNKMKAKANFHKMEKQSLKEYLILSVFDNLESGSKPNQVFIAKVKRNSKSTGHFRIHYLIGTKKNKGLRFLWAFYPFTVIFDIITFPIQYFIFPLGKTPLG